MSFILTVEIVHLRDPCGAAVAILRQQQSSLVYRSFVFFHNNSDGDDTEVQNVDKQWYKKATYFVNHVNKISKELCLLFSFALDIILLP